MQPITPNKFPSRQVYLESLSRKIIAAEGIRPEIYADPKGIPTVGPGYALVVRSEGDRFAPRDRKEIGDDLSIAMHGEKGKFRMSDAAYARLERAAAALNRGDKAAAQAEAAALRREKGLPVLSDSASRRLALPQIEMAEKRVRAMIGKVADDMKLDPRQTAAFIEEMKNSREMQALTSLRYNGAVTPEAAKALLEGDRVRAYFEIAYGTNREQNDGIANRRVREAGDILGDPSELTAAERKSLDALMQNPDIREKIEAYEKRFPDAFKDGGRLRAPSPGDGKEGGVAPNPDRDAGTPAEKGDAAPKPEAAATPEAQQMMARLSRGGETISEIVLKDPAKVTQGELDRVIGADLYRNSRDPLFEPANKLSVNWFDRVYAGLKSKADEPIAQRRIAKRVTPSMTPDGEPVLDVAVRIGRDLIGFADGGGKGEVKPQVARLQSAINHVTPWYDTLKQDGVFGPLTHAALRGVLARDGLGPLQRAFPGG